MAKSNEPIWWSLFAGGGGVAAMLLPVHIVLFGIAYPLDWWGVRDALSYEKMHALVSCPLVKLYLLALISLPLFHAAHRIKFTLQDLGLKDGKILFSLLFYGGGIVGTLGAACYLFSV